MAKIYRIEWHTTVDTFPVDAVTSMHYQTDVPLLGSEPSAEAVLSHVLDHFSNSGHNCEKFRATFYGPVKLVNVVCREEVANPGEDIPDVAQEAIDLSGTGSITGDRLPVPTCVWINCTTGAATRSGRGGFHLPPILNPVLLTSSGSWDPATSHWTTNILPFCTAVYDVIDNVFDTTGDIKPIIYSRTRRARALDPFTFDLTNAVPSTRVRWLRRRATAP